MSTHDFPVQQAEDRLPARRVLLVAAATVVLGCACVLVSWRLGIAAGHGRFERCVVFHSLSKRSSVPGLRSGFVCGDPEIISRFLLYRTYHGSAMPVPTQLASVTA